MSAREGGRERWMKREGWEGQSHEHIVLYLIMQAHC